MNPARLVALTMVLMTKTGLAEGQARGEHRDIPPAAVFDSVLKHDLTAYFALRDSGPISVSYQLLRDGPTITGIAYPKYYVWVVVRSGKRLVRVGAARVAAINRSFEVTNFVEAQGIVRDPASVRSVFPAPLLEEIGRRARGVLSSRRGV